jgi:protocatechuate 3,4-dioxygenase beta subunit
MIPITPHSDCEICHRRHFLRRATAGAAALFTVPGALAEALQRTPADVEGPFYPDNLPLDTDNDLLVVNDKITPAVGAVTYLGGVVMDVKGQPLRNALVEIWQVDNKGIYLHSKAPQQDKRDSNFQSYGRFLTDAKGHYHFRTIRPPAYPGRTPHIHYAVSYRGKRILTTQLYIEGEKQNAKDFLYRRIGGGNKKLQKLVTIPFKPIAKSKIGELTARMDLIVGLTPGDPGQPKNNR